MHQIPFTSVDDYIALQPPAAQAALDRVRTAIRKALPEADEMISYNMPTYKVGSRIALCFAGWKQHYSMYPASAALVKAFEHELASYTVDKRTIRFPFSEPVPVKLLARIAKFRARELAMPKQKAASRA